MFGQVAQKYQTHLLSFALVCKCYHLEITSVKEPQSGVFIYQYWSLGLLVKEARLCLWSASEIALGQGGSAAFISAISDKNGEEDVRMF